MGLLQKAVETYESHYAYASENHVDSVMMAPIGHIVTRADLEITLTAEGDFVNAAAVDKSEPKIVIPVTEGSAGRAGAPCAHPLCEQLGYLMPGNGEKYRLYIEQLTAWETSAYRHPKLSAVLAYVQSGTILQDLVRCGLVERNASGRPADEKQEKLLVRWRVLGEGTAECWLDKTLFDKFTSYYTATRDAKTALCMVSGEETTAAIQHPKGIIPISGNAKLISANDSSGFTYRGRFSEKWQAAEIGYEASQKAHNALRWLAQTQGVKMTYGGRTFLCWNPQGRSVAQPMNPLLASQSPRFSPSAYQEALRDALAGRRAELKLTDGVVLAAFDAATAGRLSLTYYNELQGYDFLQRLYDWDASCCWNHRYFGVQSPPLRQIVDCAFGTQRTEKGTAKLETDERVLRQQMQRMIASRVDRTLVSTDIVKALADRASRPLAYDERVRENILFTACAVIRKYRSDRFKEEWEMSLEPERRDRSYQFGRLLAIMEKVERDTYDKEEKREPNAIRMQSVFCRRPMHIARLLDEQLERAYFPRLPMGSRIWYKNLMGQILETISAFPGEDWNKPLEDNYLMGYYLQRTALYSKKPEHVMEENEQ